MAKVNYNGTADAAASKQIAAANAARTSFFFRAVGGDCVLNFGDDASSTDVRTVKQDEEILMTNSHKEPFDIRASIHVYSAGANAYQAQAEE
jgi:acyl-homoserine lactone acylase PvdQ